MSAPTGPAAAPSPAAPNRDGPLAYTVLREVCATQAPCGPARMRVNLQLEKRGHVRLHLAKFGGRACRSPGRVTEVGRDGRTISLRLDMAPAFQPSGLCRALGRISGGIVLGPLEAGEWTVYVEDARVGAVRFVEAP